MAREEGNRKGSTAIVTVISGMVALVLPRPPNEWDGFRNMYARVLNAHPQKCIYTQVELPHVRNRCWRALLSSLTNFDAPRYEGHGIVMNVGLVGCGRIAEAHMQAWRRIRSAHISAVCDTVEDRAKQMAERWRVPTCYTDLANMIQREDLQFLSICTPPLAHIDQARMAIESGVNAVVEKPLAMSAKDVEEIAEICQRSKARLTVISNLLFTSAVARARRILASLHDEPISLDLTFLKPAASDYMAGDPSHWIHRLPGGIFGEMLFHPIYLISFFLGELSVRGIYLDKFGTQDWLPHDELTVFLGSARKRATIRTFYNSLRYSIFLDLCGQKYALKIDIGTNDVFVIRDSKAGPTAKAVDCTRQAYAVFENIRGAVLQGISYHLGIKHSPIELNIRSFVESVAKKKPSVITLEDAYKMTLIQEEITTLIDKAGAPNGGVSASPHR